MAKVIILQNYLMGERKALGKEWVAEDVDTRLSTSDIHQAAVWVRQGYDVVLLTNAFDGATIEIRDKTKQKKKEDK